MNFLKNKTSLFMFIATFVLVILMALSTLPKGVLDFTGNVFGVIITPVQKLLGGVVDTIGDGVDFVLNIGNLDEENSKLKEQISVLNSEAREINEIKSENERLRAMLSLKQKDTERIMVSANIISGDADNWFSVFTLDCGSSDSVKVNDAVITNDGLVGYIYEVGYNWSKAKTILDPSGSVSSQIDRIRANGICSGDISLKNSFSLRMSYLTLSSAVIVGDDVVTSGLGGLYPKGIHIGKVSEIRKASDGMSQIAIVKTSVKFDEIGEVFVIVGNKANDEQ